MAGPFEGKVAVVTGGASGIGRELVRLLVRRGAETVVAADIDEAGAAAVAAEAPATVAAARVDVTDAAAVAEVIERTAREHGRIDLLFNNAGIGILGEVHELDLEVWYRTLDVNLRGVIHGIHAGYPIMIEQGFGHIVNTASTAGLVPCPGITPYAASKFAVVGLSTSLRAEAAEFGVRVSAVCPGVIDTPILNTHSETVSDAAARHRDKLLEELPSKPYPPDRCARDILAGVVRNLPIIPVTWVAKSLWLLNRISPTLGVNLATAGHRRTRRRR